MFNVNSKDLPCRQSTLISFLFLMPSSQKASPAYPPPFSGLNFLTADVLTQVRMKTGPQFQKEHYICFFHNTHKFSTFITGQHQSCQQKPHQLHCLTLGKICAYLLQALGCWQLSTHSCQQRIKKTLKGEYLHTSATSVPLVLCLVAWNH